jgi:hypothetical protein
VASLLSSMSNSQDAISKEVIGVFSPSSFLTQFLEERSNKQFMGFNSPLVCWVKFHISPHQVQCVNFQLPVVYCIEVPIKCFSCDPETCS